MFHYILSNQLGYVNLQSSQNENKSKSNSDGVSVINSAYNRDSKVLYSSTGINSANTEITTLYRSGHSGWYILNIFRFKKKLTLFCIM